MGDIEGRPGVLPHQAGLPPLQADICWQTKSICFTVDPHRGPCTSHLSPISMTPTQNSSMSHRPNHAGAGAAAADQQGVLGEDWQAGADETYGALASKGVPCKAGRALRVSTGFSRLPQA